MAIPPELIEVRKQEQKIGVEIVLSFLSALPHFLTSDLRTLKASR